MANNNDVQQIRLSQFILSLGPGAIIESVNGPRLIPTLRSGLGKNFERRARENVIDDVRMENLLKKDSNSNVKFFRLPSNSKKQENKGLYNTILFPLWHLCYNTNEHKNSNMVLYNTNRYSECPECKSDSSTPVRFISACPKGHLDEVNWNYVIHDNTECYNDKYYYWDADGSSLSSISLICPDCNSKKTMQELYSKSHKCSARFPEQELLLGYGVCNTRINRDKNCSHDMKIIQRQSTSLRMAQTMTLLKMPEYSNNIVKALTDSCIRTITELAINNNLTEDQYLQFLESSSCYPKFIKNISNYIKKDDNSYKKLLDYAESLYFDDKSYEDVVLEEFELLRREKAIDQPVLRKQPVKKYKIKINNYDFEFKVSAVDKISSVTVQTGYQRKPYQLKEKEDNGEENFVSHPTVSSGEQIGNEIWYPAVESEGEGIFITSDMNPLESLHLEEFADEWKTKTPNYRTTNNNYKNPFFVWWHSFSHMIIKKLAYESGYSEASIRERVYFDNKNKIGGVLLYTTSSGEDGSLGGLVELTKNFEEILNDSFKMIDTCSFDPLCLDSHISQEKVNGAACIYCLLLSETSCEHRNMWLDRHLLLNK